MAVKKSSYTGGNSRLTLPSPYVANTVTEEIITHVFKEDINPEDILELAYLPPYCRILGATILGTAGVGVVNAGFISGEVGSTDEARQLGQEIFTAADTANETDLPLLTIAAIRKSDAARSIGVKPVAKITRDPEGKKKLWLRIRFATGVSEQN